MKFFRKKNSKQKWEKKILEVGWQSKRREEVLSSLVLSLVHGPFQGVSKFKGLEQPKPQIKHLESSRHVSDFSERFETSG